MSMTRKDSPKQERSFVSFDTSMRDYFAPREKDEESRKLESKKN